MRFLVVIQSHSALFSAYLYGPTSSKKLARYKLGKVQSTSLFKLWSGFRNRVNRIGIEWERMSLE